MLADEGFSKDSHPWRFDNYLHIAVNASTGYGGLI
jgi:hypothetical protein